MPTSVPIVPRPISDCPATTMGMARYLAIKAVKRQMQAQGLKISYVEMRIITAAANDYLRDHRDELLEEAAGPAANTLGSSDNRGTVYIART
jgi:hypothetical protein